MVSLYYVRTAEVEATRVGTVAVLMATTDVLTMHVTLIGVCIAVTILDTVRFVWTTDLEIGNPGTTKLRSLVVDGVTLLERLLALGATGLRIVVLLGTDVFRNFANEGAAITVITLGTDSINLRENVTMTVVQVGATFLQTTFVGATSLRNLIAEGAADLTTAVFGLADLRNLGADRLRTSAEIIGAAEVVGAALCNTNILATDLRATCLGVIFSITFINGVTIFNTPFPGATLEATDSNTTAAAVVVVLLVVEATVRKTIYL